MRIIVLCAGILLLSAASGAETQEAQIKELSKAPISYEVASKWFKLSKKITDEGLRQEVVRAAGAAVLHSKRGDIYEKTIKPQIKELEKFEGEFYETCSKCGGNGKCDNPCPTCKGAKKCAMSNCHGGMVTIRRISGNVTDKCGKCKGSGLCTNCGGNGSVQRVCSRCNGKKRVANKDSLLKSYQTHVSAVAKWGQESERKESKEPPKAVAEKREDERKEAKEQPKAVAEKRDSERDEPRQEQASEKDALDELVFFENGCGFNSGNSAFILVENSLDEVNYFLKCNVNSRPRTKFIDAKGNVDCAYYASDDLMLCFPTPESRRLWVSAMRSGFNKMLEWIDTAIANKVGHLEKELPESAFKDGYAYACVDLVPFDDHQVQYSKILDRSIGSQQFAKTSRQIEFKCTLDSRDYKTFHAKLYAGVGGEFPFTLFVGKRNTVEEIRASVDKILRMADPDSLEKAWDSQTMRNSMFKEEISSDDVRNRLTLPEKDEAEIKKSVGHERKPYSDCCVLSLSPYLESNGDTCVLVKDTAGNWNYVLELGFNGIAQRRVYRHGRPIDSDFIFDWNLLFFPTEDSRKRFYNTIRRSCAQMLKWVELASEKRVPVVDKPVCDPDGGDTDELVACYNLITSGQGQADLIRTAVRTHITPSEYTSSGRPVTLHCRIRKFKEDPDYKCFEASLLLQCGDSYRHVIFKRRGTYQDIQKDCVRFLHKIDPDGLMEAWKEKYGKADLFK